MTKRLFTLLIIQLVTCLSFSQGFRVKDFKPNINDGSAFHAPQDETGHPCGLIKVRTDNADLKFKGNIVGEVENKTNEYWVFMAQGSKSLNILHPNLLPISVDFVTFGVDEIVSKSTYVLTLTEQKFKKEKCGLVTTVKPETASLYINDVFVENISGNGFYQLYLPKGDYVCRIEQKGYRPDVQAISVGKCSQNLNVELESIMAELEVKCKTGTAEIFIDGERKSNGSWKGSLLAGEHQIEARQQNFESNIQSISLAEKESRTISIPELKRSMGKIRIETKPINLPIVVDGQSVGSSPCTVDVVSGKHYVLCSTYGCLPCRKDVEVDGLKTNVVNLEMEFTSKLLPKEIYQKAYSGNIDAIVNIIEVISEESLKMPEIIGKEYGEETVFWFERLSSRKVYFDKIENRERFENQNHPDLQSYIERVKVDRYFKLIRAYGYSGNADGASQLLDELLSYPEGEFDGPNLSTFIGDIYLAKAEYDNAINLYNKALDFGTWADFFKIDAYKGLGDCYKAKGDKQRAASFYLKFLSVSHDKIENERVEKKLKELGY